MSSMIFAHIYRRWHYRRTHAQTHHSYKGLIVTLRCCIYYDSFTTLEVSPSYVHIHILTSWHMCFMPRLDATRTSHIDTTCSLLIIDYLCVVNCLGSVRMDLATLKKLVMNLL